MGLVQGGALGDELVGGLKRRFGETRAEGDRTGRGASWSRAGRGGGRSRNGCLVGLLRVFVPGWEGRALHGVCVAASQLRPASRPGRLVPIGRCWTPWPSSRSLEASSGSSEIRFRLRSPARLVLMCGAGRLRVDGQGGPSASKRRDPLCQVLVLRQLRSSPARARASRVLLGLARRRLVLECRSAGGSGRLEDAARGGWLIFLLHRTDHDQLANRAQTGGLTVFSPLRSACTPAPLAPSSALTPLSCTLSPSRLLG